VAPRVWLEPEDRTRPIRIPLRHRERVFEARGLVGLSAAEVRVSHLEKALIAGRWFRPEERQVVLISERMAQSLGIALRPDVADTLTLWGAPFKVVGVFAGEDLHRRPDLDGEPLTPVIFPHEISREMTEEEMEAWESGEDVRAFQSRYDHIDEATTLILPYQTLLAAGGKLKSVAVKPAAGEVKQDVADNLADRFGISLFAGEAEGTFLYTASDTLSYSGVPYIVVPVLISIFIVLNTMIGSVYERKREIGIYTSVGLAPSHVSFLFIAESLAFAVLSVVLGYLLAQTTAAVFSGTAFWSGITVNYSSLAGVGAMVLVIGVVLVSVLYPSRVAAEIAIPDVNRSWKMPEPRQNVIVLTLPFLIKGSEQRSVGGFLLEHFRGHQEVSHGLFSTGDITADFHRPEAAMGQGGRAAEADAPQRPSLVIQASVWLAPFDFGVKQNVRVDFRPSAEEPGFFELRLRLEREAGEANIWGRINRVFVNDLRKHLLIWRSLDEKTQDSYRREVGAARATARATGYDTATAH
jgi:hypothetical protein